MRSLRFRLGRPCCSKSRNRTRNPGTIGFPNVNTKKQWFQPWFPSGAGFRPTRVCPKISKTSTRCPLGPKSHSQLITESWSSLYPFGPPNVFASMPPRLLLVTHYSGKWKTLSLFICDFWSVGVGSRGFVVGSFGASCCLYHSVLILICLLWGGGGMDVDHSHAICLFDVGTQGSGDGFTD